ncbi:hypothetical protein ANCCAN_02725 [Ancylostoma caninum]|uniref:Secreted protein n=1 Tax=Ancylostoma caninum TaxID=29170 RepID=A0A368H6A1_ANCCA|nr:hypothetical protein ANCCAN_02725 [Ancylostoma caninum]
MDSPPYRNVALLATIMQIAFACLAVNNGDSEPPTSSPQPICSQCPAVYVPNCNGLTGRHLCLTSTQAQVHRTEVAGKCIFNYTCPEPTAAYAWPLIGDGPIVITGELHCNAPNHIWRNTKYGPISKMGCMSQARTRCGGCVDIYEPRDPCPVSSCAPRRHVGLSVYRDPSNRKRCLLHFLCPVGTEPYIFEGVGKGYVKAPEGTTLTCTDNGPGSSWYAMLAPPFEDAYVEHISCFSAT